MQLPRSHVARKNLAFSAPQQIRAHKEPAGSQKSLCLSQPTQRGRSTDETHLIMPWNDTSGQYRLRYILRGWEQNNGMDNNTMAMELSCRPYLRRAGRATTDLVSASRGAAQPRCKTSRRAVHLLQTHMCCVPSLRMHIARLWLPLSIRGRKAQSTCHRRARPGRDTHPSHHRHLLKPSHEVQADPLLGLGCCRCQPWCGVAHGHDGQTDGLQGHRARSQGGVRHLLFQPVSFYGLDEV